jgi:8-hydroxy-5-deazaflavin:NADPH oxidoreductase
MAEKTKVAVIGLGNIGTIVATNLVKGNRAVIIADRTFEKASRLANELGELATPRQIADAFSEADIIVLAVWFNTIQELLKNNGPELQNKIIIDPSNPIALDEKGGFKKIIGTDESAGLILSNLLPKGVKLAKAFGTLGAASLSDVAFQQPEKAVLFYASDDASINNEIQELISDSGFEPVHIGNLDQSIRIETFGDLHEFGALGKTITLKQAQELLP